jgi:hypothetical protein
MEFFMSEGSNVKGSAIQNIGFMVSVLAGCSSVVLWLVVTMFSSDEGVVLVNGAKGEVTIDLSRKTRNVKDCVLLEKDDKYYLSCKMKD